MGHITTRLRRANMFRIVGFAMLVLSALVGGCAPSDQPSFSCTKVTPGSGTSDQTRGPAHKDAAGYPTCQ